MKLKTKTKSFIYKTLMLISILAVLTSCSRKKNKWLNRNYHAMTTYYNILYHGNIALENGKTQVDENYVDDYWEILPIERLANTEEEIKYGEMVEVPPAVMPQRPKPKEETDSKKKSLKDNKSRDAKDAFSAFENAGSENQNNQNNQGRNQNQGGLNQGQGNQSQGMNQNQGGMNQGQGNQSQGGIRGGGQGMAAQSSFSGTVNRGEDGSYSGFGDKEEEDMPFDEAFEAAEEKAAKGIQKHNMLIRGEEHNPQMKDAFLLLGKSRYYQKRYFPALEAFNYILNKYDDEEVMTSAEIWLEKTYMRLENYDRVKKNLKNILDDPEELSEEDIVEASSTLAQAYLDTEEKENAIQALNIAINTTKDKNKKGRFLYVKGQIFQSLNQIDSSNTAFNQVIDLNRRTSRAYRINSFMEKSKNFDFEKQDKDLQLDTLQKLLADRENRPFLDIINYGTAEFYKELDDMPKAITYYNKSLRTNTSNHGLKERIYRTLGDYNFDHAKYKEAGAYYDSTMVNLPEASLDYRRLRRKRLSLNDVIMYEEVASKNDSILHLVEMSPEKREAYFQVHVDSLKEKAIADAEKAIKESKKAKMAQNMFGTQPSQSGSSRGFYFYDANQIASGQASFRQVWGNRALQDNWRIEQGKSLSKDEEEEQTKNDYIAAIEADPTYQVETYINQIPDDEEYIEEIRDDRNFAYYQLGVIYHEKFSEFELAADKLESLLENNPEERLILPAKYNLHKIYSHLEKTQEAEKWKQDILSNHPDSRYAKVLRNPEELRKDESNPIQVYNTLYKKYQAGNYEEVVEEIEEYIEIFLGHAMVPKFELLKATILGRLYGFDAYEEALDYVALAHPQSEEGKKAEQIIKESLPKMKNAEFEEKSSGNHNLIYPFATSDREAAEELKGKLDEAIEELEEKGLSTSIDVYSPEQIFVVIKGLNSKMGAEGFGEKLRKEEDYEIEEDNFGISSKNYEILLMHKKLNEYRQQFKD